MSATVRRGEFLHRPVHVGAAAGYARLCPEGVQWQVPQRPALGIGVQESAVQQPVGNEEGIAWQPDVGGVGSRPEQVP